MLKDCLNQCSSCNCSLVGVCHCNTNEGIYIYYFEVYVEVLLFKVSFFNSQLVYMYSLRSVCASPLLTDGVC